MKTLAVFYLATRSSAAGGVALFLAILIVSALAAAEQFHWLKQVFKLLVIITLLALVLAFTLNPRDRGPILYLIALPLIWLVTNAAESALSEQSSEIAGIMQMMHSLLLKLRVLKPD